MESPDGGRDGSVSVSAQARVADELRRAIISGELAPKSQVSEAALAAEHGVSRTPIREALKQLETEGLVRIVPRVGTFVTAPSWTDIIELSQVREVVEGLAARLVAQRGDRAVVTSLSTAVDSMENAARIGDLERCAVHSDDFHTALVVGSGNRKLLQFYRQLMNQMAYQRSGIPAHRQLARAAAAAAEHRAVVDAVLAGDVEAAEYAMREHIRRGQRAAAIERLDGPPDPDDLSAFAG